MLHEEIGFWLAVALVAVVGVALFKLIAGKSGIAPLQELAAFV